MVSPEFWNNRKVFLTGHTGFKGAWLSIWLHSMGAKLAGYSLSPPTEPSLFSVANVDRCMEENIIADVCDYEHVKNALQAFEPSVVIHMAAQSLVRQSYLDPLEINVTSDKCYENHDEAFAFDENCAMGGYDPYSNSKGCAELITSAFRRSFLHPENGVSIASARAGNVIGGGDWAADRIVPDAVRAFLSKKNLVVRNPKAVRPWQHVLEPLSGYLILCQNLASDPDMFAQGWNFGSDSKDASPVSELLELIQKYWKEPVKWSTDGSSHPHEAKFLKLDCSKAKRELKWKPAWDLDRSVKELVDWYQAWDSAQDMAEFSLNQIARYRQSCAEGYSNE